MAAKGIHLTSVGAYYHNDGPDGFGVLLEEPGTARQVLATVQQMYDGFRRQPSDVREAFLRHDIYQQLAEAKRLIERQRAGESLTTEEETQIVVFGIGNVFLLQEEGLLTADEYNGMLLHYDNLANEKP